MFPEDTFDLIEPVRRDILYQSSPRPYNSRPQYPHRRDWKDSLETYQNAARREYHLLLANHRQTRHCLTLRYDKEFTFEEINSRWSVLKDLLKQWGIIAFMVSEVTTHRYLTPDGNFKSYPINKMHRHFLVANDWSERRLCLTFNRACIDAGFTPKEFTILYERIRDRKHFEDKAKYILKYDQYAYMAVLFRWYTGIRKIEAIGSWFINPDGTRMNKDKAWKAIIVSWYPEPLPEPRQPVRIFGIDQRRQRECSVQHRQQGNHAERCPGSGEVGRYRLLSALANSSNERQSTA